MEDGFGLKEAFLEVANQTRLKIQRRRSSPCVNVMISNPTFVSAG
jgi:hypothetical protein